MTIKTYEELLESFTIERLVNLKEKLKGFNLPLSEEAIDNIIKDKLNNIYVKEKKIR